MQEFIMMVGPSGAGKSTFIKENFPELPVVSSDQIRVELFGSFESPECFTAKGLKDTFDKVDKDIITFLYNGDSVVYDATNIKKKDRVGKVKFISELFPNVQISYNVINRPLEEKLETRGWRSEELIQKHEKQFQSNRLEILDGDGNENVEVFLVMN